MNTLLQSKLNVLKSSLMGSDTASYNAILEIELLIASYETQIFIYKDFVDTIENLLKTKLTRERILSDIEVAETFLKDSLK